MNAYQCIYIYIYIYIFFLLYAFLTLHSQSLQLILFVLNPEFFQQLLITMVQPLL